MFPNELNHPAKQDITNDKFYRAIWSLTPLDVEEEIIKDLHISGHNSIVAVGSQLLDYSVNKINDLKRDGRDPLDVIFEKIRDTNDCQVLCKDPNRHFYNKRCFPFYKILRIIQNIDENAAIHLKSQKFRDLVLNNVEEQQMINYNPVIVKNQFPVYRLPENSIYKMMKKKIILTIHFFDLENFNLTKEAEYEKCLHNLLRNIEDNFIPVVSPKVPLKDFRRWAYFVRMQLKKCDHILLVLTPSMTHKLLEMTAIPNRTTQTYVQEVPQDTISCLELIWRLIIQSEKPIVGIELNINSSNYRQSDLQLNEDVDNYQVRSLKNDQLLNLVPVIFQLPIDYKLLLGFLLRSFV